MEFLKKLQDFFVPEVGVEDEGIIEDEKIVTTGTVATTVAVAGGASQQVVGGQSIDTISTDANAEAAIRRSQLKVVSNGKAQSMHIQIYTPQNFDAVSEIADALKSKKSAIVNYERVELAEQRRICDFLNGVCYVQNGEVRRITATMVLYVPDGVDIDEIKSVAPDAAPMQY